jgi:hypothetical protein
MDPEGAKENFFMKHESGGSHDLLLSFYGCEMGLSLRQP